jgi:methionine-rich copper-binding protein CopC
MRFRQIIALVGAIFLALSVSPASAHTVLVNSIPQSESVISSLPPEITITFAEELIDIGNSNSIEVLDESGLDVSQGAVLVSGPTLSKALIPSDKAGEYKVEYRAVAADGHVIKGEFTFSVEASGVTTAEIKVDPITNSPSSSGNKLSIYLILSVTAIVGGSLILIFIWKKQRK